jgi:hypothetical protein
MAAVGTSPIARCWPEEIAAINVQHLDERNNRHDPPMEFVKNLDRQPFSAEKTEGGR